MTGRKGRARCEGRLPAKMTYVENCFEMKLKNGKWQMTSVYYLRMYVSERPLCLQNSLLPSPLIIHLILEHFRWKWCQRFSSLVHEFCVSFPQQTLTLQIILQNEVWRAYSDKIKTIIFNKRSNRGDYARYPEWVQINFKLNGKWWNDEMMNHVQVYHQMYYNWLYPF